MDKNNKKSDVTGQFGKDWVYTDKVKDHFFNPRNLVKGEVNEKDFDGVGYVGSPACGDVMKMWIKVKKEEGVEKIADCKWQTFGCASAISSTSVLSVMITEDDGMELDKALRIKPQDIITRLEDLPERKIHCSVLGDKALRSAINDYYRRSGQKDKMQAEGVKMIDKILKITDKDIEDAVLHGAHTFEQVQERTKVGTGDKSCISEAQQLTRFYVEKYYGGK